MLSSRFKVVLDANVLFPGSLRDTLLRAVEIDLYQPYWSEEILNELSRNLIKKREMTDAQAEKLISVMSTAFEQAMVSDYEYLIEAMPNADEDRHVAAAAVKVGAELIVTNNLKDFSELPRGIEAKSADEFLVDLLDMRPAGMVEILRKQAADLRNPPKTFEELLSGMANVVPTFVEHVRLVVARDQPG